ncbi:Hypothetical predicted protein [Octopus vulgaris]|uniref:Uncharacterized protein n=1 Tax=Octopus vulgaris TaxID=6645 RepID=A0AA36B377_OCTVU|nr:Hypothetical predicted protein [Octopus vulgaris]
MDTTRENAQSCWAKASTILVLCYTSETMAGSAQYQYPNRMESQKRHSYTISHKLQVRAYAKEHSHRAAARHFGPPPAEKMVRMGRKQEDELQQAEKWKQNLRKPKAKWPELENELKTWVADNRNKGTKASDIKDRESGISDEIKWHNIK